MLQNETSPLAERSRVSIFERIVPFASFALASLGGSFGGWLILDLLDTLSHVENVGIGTVAGGLAEYTVLPLLFFYAAVGIGILGICVAIGRIAIASKTSSPSGISYVVLGLMSLIPAAFVWQAGSIIISVLDGTGGGSMSDFGSTLTTYSRIAMFSTPFILAGLLAWSLIPFKARHGRRFGPVIALVFIQLILVAVAVAFQLRIAELWRLNLATA
jgi:hypothetical protein